MSKVRGATAIRRLLAVVTLVSAMVIAAGSGCSDAANVPKGYKTKSGNFGTFILASVPKFGVRILTTNNLPAIPGRWHYKDDSNEFHVLLEGDHFLQVHAFLTKVVGPPPGPPITNSVAELRKGAYYGTNMGATLRCAGVEAPNGKQYTILVLLGYPQPQQAANYWKLLAEEAKKGDEYKRALDAARPSAPYLVDFVRLFPAAEVNYRHFAGGWGFDVSVDLHERYEFGVQLPVQFDSSRQNVIGYGEPRFHIWEAASVKRRTTMLNPAGERRFGSAEWQKIVDSGGDFGAIGYAMITNRPVPGFKDRKMQE